MCYREKEIVSASGHYMKAIVMRENQTLRTHHYRSNRIRIGGKIWECVQLCWKSW